ncbi:MAG: hypothetical protein ABEN55_22635, partial [Bradymonadaceae bacterium]
GIAVRSALPDEVKKKIKQAFLDLNKPEHKELLKSIYGAEKLVERSHDEHVSALSGALKTVGADKGIEGFGAGSGSGHEHGGEGEGSGSGHEHGKEGGHDHGKEENEGEGAGSGAGHGSGSGSGAAHGHEE